MIRCPMRPPAPFTAILIFSDMRVPGKVTPGRREGPRRAPNERSHYLQRKVGFSTPRSRRRRRSHPAPKRRDGRWIPLIAQHEGRVAKQSAPTGASQRAGAELSAKAGFIQVEQACEIGRIEIATRAKGRIVFPWRFVIPGANVLADIAAEEPIPQAAAQQFGNR